MFTLLLILWCLWTFVIIYVIKSEGSARQIRKSLDGKWIDGTESVLDYLMMLSILPGVLIMKALYYQPFKKKK